MTELLKLIFKLFFKQIEPVKSELPYKHLIESETAKKKGIDNTPNDEQVKNLQQLNLRIYTPIKTGLDKLGKNLIVTSGFRSPELNKHIGGSPNSDHMKGCALDLICESPEFLFKFIKGLDLPYFQLIKEPTWCHISIRFAEEPLKQDLEAYMENGLMKYRPI